MSRSQPLLKPVIRIQIIIIARDPDITELVIKGLGFGQGAVGVQPRMRQAYEAATQTKAARFGRNPQPFDFSGGRVQPFQPAATDRLALAPGHHKDAVRCDERGIVGGSRRARIEIGVKALR